MLLKRSFSKIPSGLLAVFKPEGLSSSDVVAKVKKQLILGIKGTSKERVRLKVGHGGTLDPMATGVLVLGVGEGTKLLSGYLKGAKEYVAVAKLGVETDTLDSTGSVCGTASWEHITMDALRTATKPFVGNIMQSPPMYSAIKRKGVRLYELARKGVTVDRPPRPVTVFDIEVVDSGERKLPEFAIKVRCGGGFYIRSLISDIGEAVESKATMTALLRTKQGPFTLEHCVFPDGWNDFELMCESIDKCSMIAATENKSNIREMQN